MKSSETIRILVVEDDPLMSLELKELLEKEFSAKVETADDCASTREKLSSRNFEIVIMDYKLPDGDGLELLAEITAVDDHPFVIMVTGHGDEKTAARSFRVDASGYVIKDKSLPDLLPEAVEKALAEAALKRAEEALQESEERLMNIFNSSPIGIRVYDPKGELATANKAYLDIFGVAFPEKITGIKLFEDPYMTDKVKERLNKGETVRYEASFDFEKVKELDLYKTTKSGIIELDVLITPLCSVSGGPSSSYLVQVQDITERKRAEEEIIRLTRQLLKEQDEATRNTALNLHDEIGQTLNALKLEMDMLQKEMGDEVRRRLKERLVGVSEVLEYSIDTVRSLSRELSPALLDDFGLGEALSLHLREFSTKTGINATLETTGELGDLPKDLEVSLFRIAQESIANIQKHADAKDVKVYLTAREDSLVFTVNDDGKGFEVNKMLQNSVKFSHFGLLAMRERAHMVGGDIGISSKPGAGTTISVKVPRSVTGRSPGTYK